MSVDNSAQLRAALATLRTTGGVGSGIKGHTTERDPAKLPVSWTPDEQKAEVAVQQQLAAAQTNPLAHPEHDIVMGLGREGKDTLNYVAAYGQEFEPAPLPADIKRGEQKQCYRNASLLVMGHPELTYAEGFARSDKTGDLTFMHAWAVTKDGKVVDPTWDHPENGKYFGVKYDRSKYLKYLYTAKIYGVLGSTFNNARMAIATGAKKLRAAGDKPGHEFHGNQYGYHVTLTKTVPKIEKNGITLFNTSNWVKASGGRYGDGEIFAFEHPGDAVHWAAKMDWTNNRAFGTGKVSVVKFKAHDFKGWQRDVADPISQLGAAGKWYKKKGTVPASDIVGHVAITTQHTDQFKGNNPRSNMVLHGLSAARAAGDVVGHPFHGNQWENVGGLRERPPDFFKPLNPHGRDTRERFSDLNGHYTNQRHALHEEIIAKYMANTTPVDHPVALILGGGMGAGKTTLVKAEGLAKGNTVDINVDKIREDLPEYRPTAANPVSTAFTHEEASDIGKMLTERAVAGKRNLTLDGTGNTTLQKLGGKVATMRAGGYEVNAEYVTTSVKEAQERADARGAVHGRFVPPTAMREAHAAVSRIFGEAVRQNLFDHARLWDTTGPRGTRPVLVSSAVGDKMTIHHPERWDEFVAKGNAHGA